MLVSKTCVTVDGGKIGKGSSPSGNLISTNAPKSVSESTRPSRTSSTLSCWTASTQAASFSDNTKRPFFRSTSITCLIGRSHVRNCNSAITSRWGYKVPENLVGPLELWGRAAGNVISPDLLGNLRLNMVRYTRVPGNIQVVHRRAYSVRSTSIACSREV
jgi:hypothetical protein